jgi:hypothetical protein
MCAPLNPPEHSLYFALISGQGNGIQAAVLSARKRRSEGNRMPTENEDESTL